MSDYRAFIVHNHALSERKQYLVSKLKSMEKFSFIEIENQEPSYISSTYSGLNDQDWHKKTRNLWTPPPSPRLLSKGEIACTASHFYIYDQFLRGCKESWLVVLEDDAVFECNLQHEIATILDDMSNMVDAIFIGGGFPHDAVSLSLGRFKNYLIKHHPATNTAVGYILSRRMVAAIMEDFTKFDMPIDYELAYLLMMNNAIVLHMDPYLISEGSKFRYQSSIR